VGEREKQADHKDIKHEHARRSHWVPKNAERKMERPKTKATYTKRQPVQAKQTKKKRQRARRCIKPKYQEWQEKIKRTLTEGEKEFTQDGTFQKQKEKRVTKRRSKTENN